MPNKSYLSGRRFEYKIAKHFKEEGYSVTRSSGSHGCADLIARNDNEILFIQCKHGCELTKKESQKFKNARIGWQSAKTYKQKLDKTRHALRLKT